MVSLAMNITEQVELFWPVVVGLAWGAASWSRRLMVSSLGCVVVVVGLMAILWELTKGQSFTFEISRPADLCWFATVALVGAWATFRCASPRSRIVSLLFLAGGMICAALGTLLEGKVWESGVMALAGTMVLYIVSANTPQFFPVASHVPPEVAQGSMNLVKSPAILVRFRMTISALVAAILLFSAIMISADGRMHENLPAIEQSGFRMDEEWPAGLLLLMIGVGIVWKSGRSSPGMGEAEELPC